MITCRLFQKCVSWYIEAERPLPSWAQQHRQHCPTCRRSFESIMTLDEVLSAGPKDERRLPSPFLHGKIMSTIRREQNLEYRPASWRFGWRAIAGTTCLVLLASIVWMRTPPAPGPGIPVAQSVANESGFDLKLPTAAQMREWTT